MLGKELAGARFGKTREVPLVVSDWLGERMTWDCAGARIWICSPLGPTRGLSIGAALAFKARPRARGLEMERGKGLGVVTGESRGVEAALLRLMRRLAASRSLTTGSRSAGPEHAGELAGEPWWEAMRM